MIAVRFLIAVAMTGLIVEPGRALASSLQRASVEVDGLIAPDREFASRAAQNDVAAALTAMFDADIVMPLPGGKFARGRADAGSYVLGSSENETSKVDGRRFEAVSRPTVPRASLSAS